MKHELTIEAVIVPGNELIVQLAQALCIVSVPPECFVWSMAPESTEVRIWITLSEKETILRELLAHFGKVPGVRRVSVFGPGQAVMDTLAAQHGLG